MDSPVLTDAERTLLNHVTEQYSTLCSYYQLAKEAAELQVVQWRWSGSHIFTPVPLWYERHGIVAGRYVKQKPDVTGGAVQTGFNNDGRAVVVRDWFLRPDGEDQVNGETFYEWSDVLRERQYSTWRGSLTAKKSSEALFESDHLVCMAVYSDNIESVMRYEYESNRVVKFVEHVKSKSQQSSEFKQQQFFVEWDANELESVYRLENGKRQYQYLRLPPQFSVADTIAALADFIYPQVVDQLRTTGCTDPVAWLGIFVYPDCPVGWIGVRTVEDFTKFAGEGDLHTAWNPAESDINIAVNDYHEQTNAVLLQHYCLLNDDWQPATDLAIEVARRLSTTNYKDIMPVSEEFLVFVTDMSTNGIADFHRCLSKTVPADLLEKLRSRGWLDLQL